MNQSSGKACFIGCCWQLIKSLSQENKKPLLDILTGVFNIIIF